MLGDLRAADAVEAHVRSGNDAGRAVRAGVPRGAGRRQSERARSRTPGSQPSAAGERLRRRGSLSAIRSPSWRRAVRGCSSRAPSWSTANGSGDRSGAATPANSSRRHATPSSRWAPTASPTGPGSSCSRPARVPASASTRPATTSRRRSAQIARLAAGGATNPEIADAPLHQRQHRRLPPPQGVPKARHQVAAGARERRVGRLIGIDYAAGGFEQQRGPRTVDAWPPTIRTA